MIRNANQDKLKAWKKYPIEKNKTTATNGEIEVNLNLSNANIETTGISKNTCHAYAQPSSANPNAKNKAIEKKIVASRNTVFLRCGPLGKLQTPDIVISPNNRLTAIGNINPKAPIVHEPCT